ncbi:MAG: SMC-Scp complex subunit ScpB [Candidatus Methanomethylophilaceae archaeon]|nr:SMC-Scp complex subunit ScpB [Candidatus Methanomethylophilaceae archaeon]
MLDRSILEAILFSSPQAVSAKELAELAGMTTARLRQAVKELDQEYESRDSALRIIRTEGGYSLQLRDEYREQAWKVSPPQIPEAALRTAALIAYHQPVAQSELVRTLGSRVYDDVRLLRSLNLLTVRKSGQTLELSTNRRFTEYFGIEAKGKKGIKEWMESHISL